jgi:putative oxidoreductase
MHDLGLLTLRLALGGLLAGHGAQKLFGAFEGEGPEATGEFMEQLGFRPGEQWAITAGLGELTGGALTTLGLASPIGPITTLAPMVVAWVRAHGDKPIWAQRGGGELPATNIAIACALAVDRIFGIRVPTVVSVLAAAAVTAGIASAMSQPRPAAQPEPQRQPQTAAEPTPTT